MGLSPGRNRQFVKHFALTYVTQLTAPPSSSICKIWKFQKYTVMFVHHFRYKVYKTPQLREWLTLYLHNHNETILPRPSDYVSAASFLVKSFSALISGVGLAAYLGPGHGARPSHFSPSSICCLCANLPSSKDITSNRALILITTSVANFYTTWGSMVHPQ